MALVKSARRHLIPGIIHNDDLLSTRRVSRAKCIGTIIDQPFHRLDGRFRQELAAIDGATVIDHKGQVLAVGRP